MIRLLIVAEGPTEEGFVNQVVAPAFWNRNTWPEPRLIPTSKYGCGGALNWDRVLRYLRNTLRESAETYVTTFFDLYALHKDFPGVEEATNLADPISRAQLIEAQFKEAAVAEAGCRADRFLPHIQPYEFESLLLSDVRRFPEHRSEWKTHLHQLEEARAAAATPEHINDGPETHPSARLDKLTPRYQKVLDGRRVAELVGLERMRGECVHFAQWLDRLEALTPLGARA